MNRVSKTAVVARTSAGEWIYKLYLNGEFDCLAPIQCSDSATPEQAIEALRDTVPVCASASITHDEGWVPVCVEAYAEDVPRS